MSLGKSQDRKSIYKNQLYFYVLEINNWKFKFKNINIIASKKETFRNNFHKIHARSVNSLRYCWENLMKTWRGLSGEIDSVHDLVD